MFFLKHRKTYGFFYNGSKHQILLEFFIYCLFESKLERDNEICLFIFRAVPKTLVTDLAETTIFSTFFTRFLHFVSTCMQCLQSGKVGRGWTS